MSDNANNPGDSFDPAELEKPAAAIATTAAPADEGDELETDLDENGDPIPTPEEELEEVIRGDKTYRIPKALKGELLMQEDYTRKTQEVAATKQEIEERRKAFDDETRLHREHIQDVAKLVGLNEQVEAFAKFDWPAYRAQYGVEATQDLQFQYQNIVTARNDAAGKLQQKVTEQTLAGQRTSAKAAEESQAVLARDIKGWSPELHGKVKEVGKHFGFTVAEMDATTDPRAIKVLHRLSQGEAAIKELAALKKAKASEDVQPLAQVGGRAAPKPGVHDALPIDEWVRRENQRLANQRKR